MNNSPTKHDHKHLVEEIHLTTKNARKILYISNSCRLINILILKLNGVLHRHYLLTKIENIFLIYGNLRVILSMQCNYFFYFINYQLKIKLLFIKR